MTTGKCVWVAFGSDGDQIVVKVLSNGNLEFSGETITTNIFSGSVSGGVLALGRTDSGELVPIKVSVGGGI